MASDAVAHAAHHGAHAVHVVDGGDEFVDGHERPEYALEARGRDALAAVAESVRTAASRPSPPSATARRKRVLAYAADRDVDVVVVGTRRRPTSTGVRSRARRNGSPGSPTGRCSW